MTSGQRPTTPTTATGDHDYVLGTHDEEIARLRLQHDVWRPRALDAWQRAGFKAGQALLDVGCGPGYATLDLAELVGGGGRVVAINRSRRFLDSLEAQRNERGLTQIAVVESDLDDLALEAETVDGAWCRWVLAFVRRPRDVLERVCRAMKPGAAFVSHEYFQYSTWRTLPRVAAFEEFVSAVIESWRGAGGEPDVGLSTPSWLEELGLAVESVRPIIDIVSRDDPAWQWPVAFMDVGLRRLINLGAIYPGRLGAVEQAFQRVKTSRGLRMITPGVVEVIARKPGPVSSRRRSSDPPGVARAALP